MKNYLSYTKKALELAGGKSKFAASRNISKQAITRWSKTGVPARHVIALEKATNGKITRHELRPDIYPED